MVTQLGQHLAHPVKPWAVVLTVLVLLPACDRDAVQVSDEINKGIALAEEGRLSEAKEIFRQVIALDSTDAEAHLRLGYIYEVADSLAAAKREYAAAVRFGPGMAAAHYNYGLMLAKEGDHQRAAVEFKRAIELNSADPDTLLGPLPHYCLGLIYAAQGEYEDAIQVYTSALELSSNLPYVHNELGKVYKKQNRLEEAEASLKRALELKEDLVGAHYDLMTVYMRMERPDLASKHKRLFEQYRDGQGK